MSFLQSIRTNSGRPAQPFIFLQSSLAQSSLPILRNLVANTKGHVLLISFLYPPKVFTADRADAPTQVVDCTECIPGYHNEAKHYQEKIISSLHGIDVALQLTVVVDSIDTLLSNEGGSTSSCYAILSEVFASVQRHRGHSRLVLHGVGTSSLTSLLCQPSFSSSLTHLIAYPPTLLNTLATSYSTPPPPLTAPERFWNVFSPIAEREHESETLVFGRNGEGYGGDELVVEIVVRSSGEGRRRGVDRTMEGWIIEGDLAGPCDLRRLESLSGIWTRKAVVAEAAPDPTKNVSFNLNLTAAQQQSKAQVPLPYAHDGALDPQDHQAGVVPEGSILYDPDSADDIDDDDPDEDLDI